MAAEDDEIVRAVAARKGSPFLSSAQAAAYLKCGERKMRRMRAACTGPRYRLHGGRIQYHVDDLIFWSRSNASEPGQRRSPNPGANSSLRGKREAGDA
jgi:hypothetical protein